jgi:hypothetical protein
MKPILPLLLLCSAPLALDAQFEPDSAQVNLYFPQLADGGLPSQRWQTSFIFFNPSQATSVSATLYIYDNNGQPLAMDLGAGSASSTSFTVPPQGTRTFTSTAASPSIVTGWAQAYAVLPLQGTVIFRYSTNGIAKDAVSSQATVPSLQFVSPAPNGLLGIAVGNVYSAQSVSVTVQALDANGNPVGSTTLPLVANGHTSFTLSQIIPTLPANFTGSVRIYTANLSDYFVAWTLNGDASGILSSLPPGGLGWPISHWDRIWLVFSKVLNAAQSLQGTWGVDLTSSPPTLQILSDEVINATGSSNGVTIYSAISELISDSPSELAFVIGHEFGHVVQGRLAGSGGTLSPIFPPISQTFAGIETDADRMGLILSLEAGYDPYAGAGALAKISMATGTSSLLSQATIDYEFVNGQLGSDPHASWGDRIDLLMQTLVATCSNPQYASTCQQYKSIVHPNFPSSEPLSRPAPPARTRQNIDQVRPEDHGPLVDALVDNRANASSLQR